MKKERNVQKSKLTQKIFYPECGTCGKANHPGERCWKDAAADLKPKRTRPDDTTDTTPESDAPKANQTTTSTTTQSRSSKAKSKTNIAMTPTPQSRISQTKRQIGTSNQNLLRKGTTNDGHHSVVWQQQMEIASLITYSNTHLFQKPILILDPIYTTNFPISFIDDYNPHYTDPDYAAKDH